MPFKETDRSEQRKALVEAWKSGTYRVADLARQFGVSRPTVYLWIDREDTNGLMTDRSRAPRQIPHRTDPELIAEVIQLRRQHPKLGTEEAVVGLESARAGGSLAGREHGR